MTSSAGGSLRHRDFRLWWLGQVLVSVALQMIEVAIGWQVYEAHHRTIDLGLIGLAEFLPLFALALPAGQLADRLPRHLMYAAALLMGAVVAAGLATLSLLHVGAVGAYFALAVGSGVAMAIESPASGAMPPTLVPPGLIGDAMAMSSVATTGASVLGPALGGLLFAVGAPFVYLIACGACVAGALSAFGIRETRAAASEGEDARAVLEGLRFVVRTPILLGAILLDLIGVLFGGAVGLLPVYAARYLHVGPVGLGLLRAAPAVGALLAVVVLSRRPLRRGTGRTLLLVVAAFGASIIVFGLSRSFVLSLVALGVSGGVDLVSMQIRGTLRALVVPEPLRGRVGAVYMVFVSASNELGTFESGLAAALIGPVLAVVAGGALTVAVAFGWRWAFPALARVDSLDDLAPAAEPPDPRRLA